MADLAEAAKKPDLAAWNLAGRYALRCPADLQAWRRQAELAAAPEARRRRRHCSCPDLVLESG